MGESAHTTQILVDLGRGDRAAADRLALLVYDELRALAGNFMAGERPDHTWQPTALAHEAYLRLIDQSRVDWKSRAHFMAVAATMMRRLLVDHARQRRARKRGGGGCSMTLSEDVCQDPQHCIDLLALDEALDELNGLNERHRQVVELRFFGGLTVEDAAHVLDVSPQTVRLDWYTARAWLRQRLDR